MRYEAQFLPQLPKESKIILPISMTRFGEDKEKRQQYNKEIDAVLRLTAESLEAGKATSVEVLSTAGLQELNWGKEKAEEVENYFWNTHQKILGKQTKFYTWPEFINTLGKEKFEANYQLIKEASTEGTEWHNLMLMTYKSTRVNSSVEKSLEYQRKEYAATLSMRDRYTHIAYMGNVSLSWSYLYRAYKELPIFTRVIIEKIPRKLKINTTEANGIIDMLSKNIAEVLTNQYISMVEKERLADIMISLAQAYVPRKNIGVDDEAVMGNISKKFTS
jgi:hypothetical protein